MRYMKDFGTPPTVGVEIEVLEWAKPDNEKKVADKLVEAGYMPDVYKEKSDPKGIGDSTYKHTYHCKCEKSCSVIGAMRTVPVKWKMEYDNSLPKGGAEFISAPFPLIEPFMLQATDAYQLMTENAVWSYQKLPSYDGSSKSTAGMHVHVSLPENAVLVGEGFKRIQHVFKLFYPELLALSSRDKFTRGLYYRHAVHPQHDPHHFFLSLNGHGGAETHVEWRLAEAIYNDVPYFSGIVNLFAALTQVTVVEKVFKALEGIALLDSWDSSILSEQEMEPGPVLAQVSSRRMSALATVALECSALVTMPEASENVTGLFNSAFKDWL